MMESLGLGFRDQGEDRTNVTIDSLKENNSNVISRVLSLIKRSTCKEDKLYLEVVDKILREKLLEESVNDTSRVQGFPKWITVFMFSEKASLEFNRIKSINSTVYLSRDVEEARRAISGQCSRS